MSREGYLELKPGTQLWEIDSGWIIWNYSKQKTHVILWQLLKLGGPSGVLNNMITALVA